jgi:hypothetical protein
LAAIDWAVALRLGRSILAPLPLEFFGGPDVFKGGGCVDFNAASTGTLKLPQMGYCKR